MICEFNDCNDCKVVLKLVFELGRLRLTVLYSRHIGSPKLQSINESLEESSKLI